MKLTVLFDLDDTLLKNDIDAFAPVYLKKMGDYIDVAPSPKLVSELMLGTQYMMAKTTPLLTLEQAFDQVFYPGIGTSKDSLRKKFESFYATIYPSLQSLTEAIPAAKDVMEYVFQEGHQVVIATNPVFPRSAILQRLDWAGLSGDLYPYEIITTYETFHFSKPHPAYYMEILAQLCWPEQPVVMIGNSWEHDILPAARIGFPTFFINDQPTRLPSYFHPMSSQGTIDQVIPWIKDIIEHGVSASDYLTCEAIHGTLKATPAALDTITANFKKDDWNRSLSETEWSLIQVICHLRDVDREVNIPRFHEIRQKDNLFVVSVDADSWVEQRNYNLEEGPNSLDLFFQARLALLNLFSEFSDDDWGRTVRHSIFGPTNVHELANFIAIHDRTHIRQICDIARTLNTQS